mmetsp:Transcript_4547/g.10699  ORF Transcript_4547/g.10699 Transcript_4547/m.10699 type:complete len:1015 (+) Transcript_4547:84-3128(+)
MASYDVSCPDADIISKYKLIAPESTPDAKIWRVVCECQGDDDRIQEAIGAWWLTEADNKRPKTPPKPPSRSSKSSAPPSSRISRLSPPKPRSSSITPRRSSSSSSLNAGAPNNKASKVSTAPRTESTEFDEVARSREKKEKKKKRSVPHRTKSTSKETSSQVKLLAEHCFTLSDDAINSLVRYHLPPATSSWDYKQKIQVRDETIRHLQRALDLLNQEKQRFRAACIEVEANLVEDLAEHKARGHHPAQAGATSPNGSRSLSRGQEQNGGRAEDEASGGLVASLRDDLAERKAALKARERECAELQGLRRELESEVKTLREQVLEAGFQQREGDAVKSRAADEVRRLSMELERSRAALETKNKELSMALTSFSDYQAQTEARSNQAFEMSRGQEGRVKSLEQERAARLEDLAQLKAAVAIKDAEIARLGHACVAVQADLAARHKESSELEEQGRDLAMRLENEKALRGRAQQMEENERRERIAACAQLLAVQQHTKVVVAAGNADAERELGVAQSELKAAEEEAKGLRAELAAQMERSAQLEGELEATRASLAENKSANREEVERLAQSAGEVEVLRTKVRQLEKDATGMASAHASDTAALGARLNAEEDKVFALESERRMLNNMLQELRGNVRVFARLRPFLPNDKQRDDEKSVLSVGTDKMAMTLRDPTKDPSEKNAEYKFSFDRAFAAHEGQEEVFADVSEFVQSALDGYNVTLFSYGQTGSGKTHSMQGSGHEQMRGIIPRAIEQVGQNKVRLEEQGWVFRMRVQFVEIYNEVVKDLLNEAPPEERPNKELRILRDAYGMTDLEGVVKIECMPENKSEIDEIMEIAGRNRSVAKTDMNAESSRSHSIFTLHLEARNERQNAVLRGQLNLCDLAGSERVDRSGVTGKALAEAKNINKSLSCLTGVFTALNQKSQHVPFRDSKLTYLLQPSFSGDGKTCMMINLSPTEASAFESLSTLRFGAMVNSVELGQATRKLNDLGEDAKKMEKGSSSGNTTRPDEKVKPPARPKKKK